MERRIDHDGIGLLFDGLCQHHTALLAFGVGIDTGNPLDFLEAGSSQPTTDVFRITVFFWPWNIVDIALFDAIVSKARSAGRSRWVYITKIYHRLGYGTYAIFY